jgi:formylmethanofuran dehydrogenase subunit E
LRCDSRLSSDPPSSWSLSFPQFRCKAGMTEKKTSIDIKMIRSAVKFHGHLGPFLVLGLRMGLAAVQILRPHGFHDLSATVWSSRSPPQSCAIDGIQFSSGCTLGKGNIRIRSSPVLRASFRSHDTSIVIEPTEKTNRMLSTLSKNETQARLRARAFRISKIPDKDLLTVSRSHHRQ